MAFLDFIIDNFANIIATCFVILAIIITILLMLAINNLHRLPQMQESVENIEKLLKVLVADKKKAGAEKKESTEAT